MKNIIKFRCERVALWKGGEDFVLIQTQRLNTEGVIDVLFNITGSYSPNSKLLAQKSEVSGNHHTDLIFSHKIMAENTECKFYDVTSTHLYSITAKPAHSTAPQFRVSLYSSTHFELHPTSHLIRVNKFFFSKFPFFLLTVFGIRNIVAF